MGLFYVFILFSCVFMHLLYNTWKNKAFYMLSGTFFCGNYVGKDPNLLSSFRFSGCAIIK